MLAVRVTAFLYMLAVCGMVFDLATLGTTL